MFHRDICSFIFHANLDISRTLIIHNILSKVKSLQDLHNIVHLCSTQTTKITQYIEQHYCDVKIKTTFVWNYPQHITDKDLMSCSYLLTVWLRVNCANAIAPNDSRVVAFLNAHLPLIRYFDQRDKDCTDLTVNVTYKSIGNTYFDCDRNFIQTKTESFQIRPYPLEIILKHYPKLPWYPEQVINVTQEDIGAMDDFKTDKEWRSSAQYYACLYITTQCKRLYAENNANPELQDALWFYYGCFVEYFCGNSPNITAATYPHDNAVFTAYDLPNAFNILTGIPVWGEKIDLKFQLGKIIKKCLPYAGARRTLSEKVDEILDTKDDAFWKVLRRLVFCMFTNMYPHYMQHSARNFDMKHLCRIHMLCENKEELKKWLKNNTKNGCYIIFTAFRMWILLMVRNQKHYLQVISKYVDWKDFYEKTIEMADIIRKDEYADGIENIKQPQIYRYRDKNLIQTILDCMSTILEKEIYKKKHIYQDTEMNISDKVQILNLLIRTSRDMWTHELSLSIMRIYGGVSEHTIYLICKLIDVYYSNSKPKALEEVADLFEVRDIKVVCWYFRVISILNKIDFEMLTEQQVEDIHYAIGNKKYMLYPGQFVPNTTYNVYFSICCNKIKSLLGADKFGHQDIALDIENHMYICSKTPKKVTQYKDDEYAFTQFERERKQARKERKEFNAIPCSGNPVITIPLKGFMLIYNKEHRYMHCPSCGSFHKMSWDGHYKDSYACHVCRHNERHLYCTCHVCFIKLTPDEASKYNLRVINYTNPIVVKELVQYLYFCKKHFSAQIKK